MEAKVNNWRWWPWRLRYSILANAASQWRRLAAQATHIHSHLRFEGPVYVGPGFTLRLFGEEVSLTVGANVDLRRNFLCEISGTGRVTIGARTVFAGMTTIQCSTSVNIGEGATFAHQVLIADGSHRFRDPDTAIRDQGYDFRPISIGPGVLVNANCTVLNDVGEKAVIGANSVVSRPIPAYCLAVGAPARVVDYFGPPDRRPADLPAPGGDQRSRSRRES